MRFKLLIALFPILGSLALVAGTANASRAPKLSVVKELVSKLFYGEQQAGRVSLASQFAYDFAHDYPGAYNKTQFFAAAVRDEKMKSYCAAHDSPDLTTLFPDQSWKGPASGLASHDGWLFTGKKPKGYTYIVTDNSSCVNGGSNSSSQVDVTILNAKAYFYFG